MPDMSGYLIPETLSDSSASSNSGDIYIDSLITINGKVDDSVVGDIKDIAQ